MDVIQIQTGTDVIFVAANSDNDTVGVIITTFAVVTKAINVRT